MMSHENHGDEDASGYADLRESRDEMESLALDDSSNGPASSSSLTDRQSRRTAFNSILEPPSYAEAIFTSFDSSSSNGFHRNQNLPPRPDPFSHSDFLRIWVSDPRKEQELAANSLVPGGTTYYTYLITTRTNLPEYGGPGSEFSVRRRFKDVVTLSDRLSESYRGFFVPIRPDKSLVDSQVMQMGQFVEQRRSALEKYLNRLASHPAVQKSEELRVFLVVKGKLPLAKSIDVASRMLDGAVRLPKQLLGDAAAAAAATVEASQATQPARGGRDLLRMLRELKQSVANDWGRVKPLVVEEDKEFLERKEWLVEFEHHLSNISKEAETLVKAQQDTGETMGELGLAFVKLTNFETEEAILDSQRVRATDMKNLATAAVKASRLYRELNAQTVKHLDKLHEYLGVMLAANGAFSDRSSALLTVQTLSSDLVSLQSRIEKLEAASSKIFGGDRSRMRKIEDLKETARVTEDAKSCAVREYERIKDNNRDELERFDKERHIDFMDMLKGFVLNQAGYAEKMANAWENLAEETIRYARDGS
ncbi:sorting nexin 2A isoform X2 [Ziziphus jujuba]|uniref:Sorting nexin 2A isoform X2 n=2 Tax=Ziziphus jujuba TaxID=326968 RepID=A0ABM3I8A4_ZIZJJ|nr:sorting nexin 2A isoform X2 [Ziziphus jujuba]